MSDQFTRISKGGTPLNPTDPVVGLLFGKSNEENEVDGGAPTLEICDAVDLPSRSEDASTIVALHQAVYTQQRVVGCYRVVEVGSPASEEPSAEDLAQTQGTQAAGALFLLLRVPKASGPKSSAKDEDSAPISIFQLTDGALVHQGDWRLETASPEKIAVERVMQEQPHAKDTYAKELASKTKLQNSLTAFQERMIVVEKYLKSSEPKDPTMLRKIQALLLKAQLVHQQDAVSIPGPLLRDLQSLTTFAEALDLGRLYTSTLKTASAASAAARRPMRGHRK